METKTGWREDQKKLTREILDSINLVSFLTSVGGLHQGCTLEHIDGESGYISIEDAMTEEWNVIVMNPMNF
jgi:hypothetical protein